jgi:imidazolonepropionase-like amidohydrolase
VGLLALPAAAETVVISNARILTAGPQGDIASGTVVIVDGRIASVAAGTPNTAPAGARLIDAHGGVVTPGFFATGSEIGAVEVSSLGSDLTVNSPDIGAAFDVSLGLDPASTLIPVARLGGITRAVVIPQSAADDGGRDEDEGREMTAGKETGSRSHVLFAGQAAVIHLAAGTDILVKPRVAMLAPFGKAGAGVAGGARGAEIVQFKALLENVRAYAANRAAYEHAQFRDLTLSKADLEALIPVVEGRLPLIATVNRASDIRALLRLAREEHLKLILSGAEEGWKVAAEIAAAGVPVLVNPLDDRPETFEGLGATMDNAGRLAAAGVTVALEASEAGAHRARETRYGAGNAVAHGMSYDAALAAITINPARIFGVADASGSLEVGKDADVVIWTGDPFEPLSQPTAVFIRGVAQPMTSRQLELRDRYRDLGRPLPPACSH